MSEHRLKQCVILKPLPASSWSQILAVSVIGCYSMPGLNEAYRLEYLRRVDESARSLLEFVRKDVADDAKLEWETEERTMEQMVEMGAAADVDSTWAVIVGINVESPANDADDGAAESLGNAWMPRFSSVMQFHVPFSDAPNLSILDGDQDYALVLER